MSTVGLLLSMQTMSMYRPARGHTTCVTSVIASALVVVTSTLLAISICFLMFPELSPSPSSATPKATLPPVSTGDPEIRYVTWGQLPRVVVTDRVFEGEALPVVSKATKRSEVAGLNRSSIEKVNLKKQEYGGILKLNKTDTDAGQKDPADEIHSSSYASADQIESPTDSIGGEYAIVEEINEIMTGSATLVPPTESAVSRPLFTSPGESVTTLISETSPSVAYISEGHRGDLLADETNRLLENRLSMLNNEKLIRSHINFDRLKLLDSLKNRHQNELQKLDKVDESRRDAFKVKYELPDFANSFIDNSLDNLKVPDILLHEQLNDKNRDDIFVGTRRRSFIGPGDNSFSNGNTLLAIGEPISSNHLEKSQSRIVQRSPWSVLSSGVKKIMDAIWNGSRSVKPDEYSESAFLKARRSGQNRVIQNNQAFQLKHDELAATNNGL